jgi:hypothetical protein
MQHQWAKISITPLDTQAGIFVEKPEGKREAYGCMICNEPLASHTESEDCKGASDADISALFKL